MFVFLVPLLCLALAVWLWQRPVLGWGPLAGLALALGLLPLVYGSCVLLWPALAFGLLRPGRATAKMPTGPHWLAILGKVVVSAGLFALPTLPWIGLLRTQGTTYSNHEAERYHQLVWLLEARHLPFAELLSLVASKLTEYLGSLQLLGG